MSWSSWEPLWQCITYLPAKLRNSMSTRAVTLGPSHTTSFHPDSPGFLGRPLTSRMRNLTRCGWIGCTQPPEEFSNRHISDVPRSGLAATRWRGRGRRRRPISERDQHVLEDEVARPLLEERDLA